MKLDNGGKMTISYDRLLKVLKRHTKTRNLKDYNKTADNIFVLLKYANHLFNNPHEREDIFSGEIGNLICLINTVKEDLEETN